MVRYPSTLIAENMNVARELTTLLRCLFVKMPHLSLLEALYKARQDVFCSEEGRLCRCLIECMQEGESADVAFAALPTYFPPSYVRTIKEAECRNQLPMAFVVLDKFLAAYV